jgi:tetratricopeptide (TPR) repeat protein
MHWEHACKAAKEWLALGPNTEAQRELVLARVGRGQTLCGMRRHREAMEQFERAQDALCGLSSEAAGELPAKVMHGLGHTQLAWEKWGDALASLTQAKPLASGLAVQAIVLDQALAMAHLEREPEAAALVESSLTQLTQTVDKAAQTDAGILALAEGCMTGAQTMVAAGQHERALTLLDDTLKHYTAMEKLGVGFQRFPIYVEAGKLRREVGIALMEESPERAGLVLNASVTEFQNITKFENMAKSLRVLAWIEVSRSLRSLAECCLKLKDYPQAWLHYRWAGRRLTNAVVEFPDRLDLDLAMVECASAALALKNWASKDVAPLRFQELIDTHTLKAELKMTTAPAEEAAAAREKLARYEQFVPP